MLGELGVSFSANSLIIYRLQYYFKKKFNAKVLRKSQITSRHENSLDLRKRPPDEDSEGGYSEALIITSILLLLSTQNRLLPCLIGV